MVHENIQKFWTSLLSGWIIWSWLWEKPNIMQQINTFIYHNNTPWIKYVLDLVIFRVYVCKYHVSLTSIVQIMCMSHTMGCLWFWCVCISIFFCVCFLWFMCVFIYIFLFGGVVFVLFLPFLLKCQTTAICYLLTGR